MPDDKNAHFTDPDEIESPKGTNHLLAIAIDAYTDGIRGLKKCVSDAEGVVEVLTEKYHFEKANTCFLQNETATYQNIIQNLEDFNRKLGENDNLVIYFSGHGTFNPHTNLGYLLPVDAAQNKVHTFLHQIVLKAYLKVYKAKHILLIMDSCYSGVFLRKEDSLFIQKTNKLPSRWVLTSGHIETVSDGDFGEKHSPFAKALINYLTINTKNALSILELTQHITEIVANNEKQTPCGEPMQDANHQGGLFFFFLKHHDEAAFKACEFKADYQAFILKHKNSRFVPEATEKIRAFLQVETQALYDKIVAAKWEEKPQLCKQFKDTYKDLNRDLYKEVIKEGKKANDYLAWQKVNKKDEFAVETFLMEHEDCFFVEEIENVLAKLEHEATFEAEKRLKEDVEKKEKLRLAQEAEAERLQEEQDRKAAEEARRRKAAQEAERKAKEDPFYGQMVRIPAGSFEREGQKVSIKDSFEIGKYQVTQKQWQQIMHNNPSHFKGENLPVEQVSWDDIQVFLQKLNDKTGATYRLPSEAEWEYAARGGQNFNYAGSDKLDEVAWYWENSGDKRLSGDWDYDKIVANNGRTHPVGQKKANSYGLYDMSGNVWEWCADEWHENYKGAPINGEVWTNQNSDITKNEEKYGVLRGGSWVSLDGFCRVSLRYWINLFFRNGIFGFRLCLFS